MGCYVVRFHEMDPSQLFLVGGKGLNLGALSKMHDIRVPEGFCVTTEAYQKALETNEAFYTFLHQLQTLKLEDGEKICRISRKIRETIIKGTIPSDAVKAVVHTLAQFSERHAYAVRSSATAEDLPHASFAGQQDTYLNVIGSRSILAHIKKCWASLFTERAITYRIQNGFNHSQVAISVIIQRMIFPQASGVLFTADPVSGNRKVLTIDASFGLGEAFVSGQVAADSYQVKAGQMIAKKIATKKWVLVGPKAGGTQMQPIDPKQQKAQTLTDQQILQLARIGRQIETYFASPQDIEWCLANGTFYLLQSRPITTLYPIPQANDQENRIYVSVGHQQMMTDAIKPLGLSFYLLTTPAPMRVAGGRLFVDVTQQLISPDSRRKLLETFGQSDPLIKDALLTVIERGDFLKLEASNASHQSPSNGESENQLPLENDPTLVPKLMKRCQTSIEDLKRRIHGKSGTDLLDLILEDIRELKKILFDPQSAKVVMTAMQATLWINEKMEQWLGEKNAADRLSQSVSHNITSEMGLDLLAVADTIRPYPAIVNYLQHIEDESFLDRLVQFDGGIETREAVEAFLAKYGMRCPGEIDITNPRWHEKPTTLIPLILNHIKNFEPQAGKRKFRQGQREALQMENTLLNRLRQLPDGKRKAQETQKMIRRLRHFIGYREYPKYGMMQRYFIYKQALLKEAERLVENKVIREKEDIDYLTFQELREVVRTHKLDKQIITQRKKKHTEYEKLTPPRVITSDGETIAGAYRCDHLPSQAMVGLAVSSGVIEGRARVILNMTESNLEEGDILVTRFTDPSWTPFFVSVAGLVTEVGGLMTHGSVIAREYGLPAVVGVENATQRIKDGQRIRVNGTDGYIEIL